MRKFFSFSFVVMLVVCGGVASSIDVVEAHAGLKSSEPAASSVLEQSPKEIGAIQQVEKVLSWLLIQIILDMY